MIKALIFDNNGVLTTSDSEATLKTLSQQLSISREIIEPVWLEEALKVDDGRVTSDEFLQNFLRRLDKEDEFDNIKKIYLTCYENKPEMHKIVKDLGKEFKLAVVTNFGSAFGEFNKKWKLEEIFGDEIYVSYKLKMQKPNPEMFEYVLKNMEVLPEEAIFIDDRKPNIVAAEKLGIKIILFNTPEQFQNDLKSILDKENSDGK